MRITKMVLLVNSLLWVVTPGSAAAPEPAKEGAAGCRELALGSRVDLHSPSSVYVFDTADGLRAVSWTNQLTAHELGLGAGPEVEFDLGLPGQPLKTPKLRVTKSPTPSDCAAGQAVFELTADDPPASVIVTYRSDATRPVLRKFVKITNCSGQEWDRLLNIRLGEYAITKRAYAPAGDERGFPVYLDDQYFMTLAHPAGLAHVHDGKVVLQQYPGARLAPGATFECIEAVYGVATVGSARQAFLDHLTSRMRRTVRGHDKPYAIFEPFGARPGGDFNETEPFVLDSIAQVGQGQRDAGCHFDLYSVDFWVDYHGTLKECDPKRFPRGLQPIRAELDKLDTALGLWIDSSFAQWSIGGNPQVQGCLNVDPNRPETQREVSWGRQSFCRATEPIKSMYTDAFRHHVREHGVRLLKFDNLASVCVNPNHDHLPGVYSTEPIYDAVIDFLRALDRECPDVFLMLYWGYRSPWWLLHGDTLFDSGLGIEAASPSTFPAPHARDSVTQRLDQAQWHAGDVPPLGKDSLGIWLSDWGWNSSIGKERWQEGLVMDLCRGSLLAQPWSDTPWLSPPERQQMAEFIALLKARPECFRQPRFIGGDPRRDEPYGYCCSDGARAFVALYNCAWKDNAITLRLNPDWGLPAGRRWELYRWYPDTAKLLGGTEGLPETAVIGLRPFDVVLLEVVPLGQTPTLDRAFETRPLPVCFQVASQSVDIDVRYVQDRPDPAEMSAPTAVDPAQTGATGATGPTTPIPARSQPASARLVVCGRVPAAPQGGLVVVTVEMMSRSGTPTELRNVGEHFSANGRLDGQPAAWQPVLGTATYPSCWQAWRLALGPATQAREIALHITADIAPDVDLRCRGYFIAR